jgi:four helix bundle protein
MTTQELEDRLIDFCVSVIGLWKELDKTYAGKQLAQQMTRASISAPLNYGEAQLGESKKDFIHKIRLTLKELKEVNVALKICFRAGLLEKENMQSLFQESNELVAIFLKTVSTAKSNL